MAGLSSYVKALDHLRKMEGLPLESYADGKSLWIDKIPFSKAQPSDLFQSDFSAKGILSPKLTREEKEFCRTYNISYLTADGSLYLVRKKSVLSIELRKAAIRPGRNPKMETPSWLKTAGDQHLIQKPIHLISPNAFAILDVLFGVSEKRLHEFSSGLKFAQAFNLYQPKLSTLISAMRVRNIVELRHAVSGLPIDWWVSALRYPAARRVMTPFFVHAKPYHSILKQSEEEKNENFLSLVLSERNQLAPGPTEVAKEFGFLRDQDRTVWGTPVALQALKRRLRLVPGVERESPTWFLASPLFGFRREAILSHRSNKQPQGLEQRSSEATNTFRAIWDLSYGDSRLAEVQVELLNTVLK